MAASATYQPLVLITGANQGIGYATAQQLAGSGKYHVLMCARSQTKVETAIKQLADTLATKDEAKATLTPVVMDVSDDVSITAAAKLVTDKFGRLDILINNAGIAFHPDGVNVGLRDTFRAVFETNVFGMGIVIETFLPLLRASQYHDRRIVNVTSGLGQMSVTYSNISVYSARAFALPVYRSSKTAVHMLTAVHAVNLADEGILVVAAAPGYCRTNFSPHGIKEASKGAKQIARAATEGDAKRLYGTIVGEEWECELGW